MGDATKNRDEPIFFVAQKDETIEIPLVDGAGRYQYSIAGTDPDGKICSIRYKDSFTVSGTGLNA